MTRCFNSMGNCMNKPMGRGCQWFNTGTTACQCFMGSIEETPKCEGKIPSFYERYVDYMLAIMPYTTSATAFLQVLNNCHSPVKLTIEIESSGVLPFLGMQLLYRAPEIKTKVYVKPTNTGLSLHYQSPVILLYKQGLLKTMLDCAYLLLSCWTYFSEECDHLKALFSQLKFLQQLANATIRNFFASKAADQQPTPATEESPPV